MPLPRPIRLLFARAVWRQISPDVLEMISRLVTEEHLTTEEARDFALEQVRDILPHLRAPILRGLGKIGARLDNALEWEWVRSDDARAWLEAHDDITPLLRASADLAIRLISREQEAGRAVVPLR
jgi:hypothetical protein